MRYWKQLSAPHHYALTAQAGKFLQLVATSTHSPNIWTQVMSVVSACFGHRHSNHIFLYKTMRNKFPVKLHVVTVLILYLTLPCWVCAMDSAYQWTDPQGQIHYGDKPPVSNDARIITLQGNPSRVDSQPGLRPGEHARLDTMEQRQRRQQQRAQTSRTRAGRQREARRTLCAENREMLKKSRGTNNFKKHSRYLRNNCW